MSARCYFELRTTRSSSGLSTDIMRHLHTRQHLGKAIIVTDQPTVLLSAARKQWLKLSRSVQKKRAATLSADKILKYTHAVTHMQRMNFTAKLPLDQPDADVYFLTPADLGDLPPYTFSTYLTVQLSGNQVHDLLSQLPAEALIVDYELTTNWLRLGAESRDMLEQHVRREWQQVEHFLTSYRIDIKQLVEGNLQNAEAMEEALDILLGASRKFLQIAHDFQHALELARPLKISKQNRLQYDAASLLAHRVQALSPGAFTQSFLETYNEDDTFFMYDHLHNTLPLGESLADAITRHLSAGRLHLAKALRLRALTTPSN